MTVFYYRSDNLSDEQKERIIDFRNYDDNGKWYVLLDEAHKVQALCYNRDAAQSDELHRRFWVGSIAELLQKVGA